MPNCRSYLVGPYLTLRKGLIEKVVNLKSNVKPFDIMSLKNMKMTNHPEKVVQIVTHISCKLSCQHTYSLEICLTLSNGKTTDSRQEK